MSDLDPTLVPNIATDGDDADDAAGHRFRSDDDADDVAGHHAAKPRSDDDDDDVAGHHAAKPRSDDDDVEGHKF